VWEAIGEVVKAARTAMDWLKACSKLAAEENLPINWRTPDGFRVYQAYYDMNKFRIATCLDGEIMRMVVQEEDRTKIDRKRMQNGIAPNFVHSLDGCALRMFVVLAKENGLDSFSMIHDSYGTHAADVEMMGACLRSAFVDLYRHHDVLEEFREEIAKMLPPEKAYLLPPVPPKSDLDIQAVLGSDFFFA
jgi:DNA-directed RNA polymerase